MRRADEDPDCTADRDRQEHVEQEAVNHHGDIPPVLQDLKQNKQDIVKVTFNNMGTHGDLGLPPVLKDLKHSITS